MKQQVCLISDHLKAISYKVFCAVEMTFRLTIQDRILLVQLFYGNDRSSSVTLRRFRTIRGIKNESDGPRRSTLASLIDRFEETGSVEDKPRSGRPSIEEDSIHMVEEAIQENPHTSVRRVAGAMGISRSSVGKVLRQHLQMHPYRVHVVHALTENDKTTRIQFCKNFLDKVEND